MAFDNFDVIGINNSVLEFGDGLERGREEGRGLLNGKPNRAELSLFNAQILSIQSSSLSWIIKQDGRIGRYSTEHTAQ